MDFSTIKNQMEAKDGTGYKNVREICADVRLVFKNAMKYNDERSDVHVMAKTLLEKFEEKWLQLLPKVTEEVTSFPTSMAQSLGLISVDDFLMIYNIAGNVFAGKKARRGGSKSTVGYAACSGGCPCQNGTRYK